MENFDKKYKDVLRKATKIYRDDDERIKHYMEVLFPELAESEDDRIRKELISFLQLPHPQFVGERKQEKWIAWLEKQESVDENEIAKGVLIEVANSIMRWLDSNCAEGNMCLSNMECEDIENAVRNANWQKIYGYMKKKLEKQGEKKSSDEVLKIRQEVYQSGYNNGYKHGIEDGKQGEQKPAIIIPKFRVGDEIKTSNEESLTITKIDEKGYWSGDLFICDFDESTIWELVEQKPQGKSALKAIKEEKVDNANKIEPKDYSSIDPYFGKSINNVEPKFHKGDTIVEKDFYECGHGTIKDIKDGRYIFTDGSCINIDEQDGWQFVKTSTNVEQRPADKTELKFHVGDWIVRNGTTNKPIQIVRYEERPDGTLVWFSNGTGTYIDFLCGYHLWTIDDAKDGDVVVCNINKAEIGGDIEKLPNITPTICIYQNVVKDKDYIHAYCSLYNGSSLILSNSMYYNTFVYNMHPATKEQCDTLERAIVNAGYRWDKEKLKLEKI